MHTSIQVVVLFATIILSQSSLSKQCQSDETLVAECHIKDKAKSAAYICADKNGKNGRYIFTRNNKSELSVVFNESNQLQRWLDKGTYTTYLGFNRGEYIYVLGIPSQNFGVKAFLDVKKDKKYIAHKQCDENSFTEKEKKGSFVRDLSEDEFFKSIFFP